MISSSKIKLKKKNQNYLQKIKMARDGWDIRSTYSFNAISRYLSLSLSSLSLQFFLERETEIIIFETDQRRK